MDTYTICIREKVHKCTLTKVLTFSHCELTVLLFCISKTEVLWKHHSTLQFRLYNSSVAKIQEKLFTFMIHPQF